MGLQTRRQREFIGSNKMGDVQNGNFVEIDKNGVTRQYEGGAEVPKSSPAGQTFGDVAGGDYSAFGADGTLRFNGAATVFLDELTTLSNQKIVGGADITTDDAENAVSFAGTAGVSSEYVFMNLQMNHDRKIGSIIHPHLHWWQTHATNIPNWLILYRWQANGTAKTTAWSWVKLEQHLHTYTSGTLNQISEFTDIAAPVGDGVSSILQVRLYRDYSNSSGHFTGTDPLVGAVSATFFDIHKEIDMVGSPLEYSK